MLYSVPMPGDAVRLDGYFCGVKQGAIAILGGRLGRASDEYLATFAASAFRDDVGVSCSGGPAPFVGAGDLVPTGETVLCPFWRWLDGRSGAGRGVGYSLEVPLWSWTPGGTRPTIEKSLDTYRFWAAEDALCLPDAQRASRVLGYPVVKRPRPDPSGLIDPGVPASLADFSVWLCNTAEIGGLSDPMYICNVVANETGVGDGQGNFFTSLVDVTAERIRKAVTRLFFAYDSHLRGRVDPGEAMRRLAVALA